MWVCASIRPGVTHCCERSMTWAPAGMARPEPIDLILPFSTRMTWSLLLTPCAGSTMCPARIATTCAESGAASNSTSEANRIFIEKPAVVLTASLCPIASTVTILPEEELLDAAVAAPGRIQEQREKFGLSGDSQLGIQVLAVGFDRGGRDSESQADGRGGVAAQQ